MSDRRPYDIQMALARLDWARRHIEDFDQKVREFMAYGPYAVVPLVELEGDGTNVTVLYSFRSTAEPPYQLRFLAGDAIHNLRAVLDNLVWSVAKVAGADPQMSLVFKNGPTHFAKFAEATKFHLLPGPVKDWITQEQLHMRPHGLPSMLHTLNKLWNRDKHRAPDLAGSVVSGMSMEVDQMRLIKNFERLSIGCLEDGSPVARALIAAKDQMRLKPDFIVDVGFRVGEGDAVSSARRFLRTVEKHIRDEVVPVLEPFVT